MHKKYITSCIQFDTSLGWLTVFATTKGVSRIKFGKFCEKEQCRKGFPARQIPDCRQASLAGGQTLIYKPLLQKLKSDILSYAQGKQVKFNYPLDISLTSFQKKVFQKVRQIPYGKTISYKELAKKLNSSPRACGQALAKNPIPIIIPCHRVIQANGGLRGFSGGLEWKIKLLQLERLHQKNYLKYKKSLQF